MHILYRSERIIHKSREMEVWAFVLIVIFIVVSIEAVGWICHYYRKAALAKNNLRIEENQMEDDSRFASWCITSHENDRTPSYETAVKINNNSS